MSHPELHAPHRPPAWCVSRRHAAAADTVAGGDPDPAFRLARRHRSLVRAGFHRAAWSRWNTPSAGGASQDPADKPGVANLVASLLDEGSGDLDSKTFHERLDRRAIELSFSATRDSFRGSLRMLKDTKTKPLTYCGHR